MIRVIVSGSFSLQTTALNEQIWMTHEQSRLTKREEIKAVLGSALGGMVFPLKRTPAFPNGPINETFQQQTTSAIWLWDNDRKFFSLLFPQIEGVRENSGICLQDRKSEVVFNREARTLQIKYYNFRRDGFLVGCLGGGSEGIEQVAPITWNSITEVQLVSLSNLRLMMFLRLEGQQEWFSLEAGVPE